MHTVKSMTDCTSLSRFSKLDLTNPQSANGKCPVGACCSISPAPAHIPTWLVLINPTKDIAHCAWVGHRYLLPALSQFFWSGTGNTMDHLVNRHILECNHMPVALLLEVLSEHQHFP